jgi:uncharacterized membrane protein (DUF106 family)
MFTFVTLLAISVLCVVISTIVSNIVAIVHTRKYNRLARESNERISAMLEARDMNKLDAYEDGIKYAVENMQKECE